MAGVHEQPLCVAYHDEGMGTAPHDDQALFELLCMETYRAGLSWKRCLINGRLSVKLSWYQIQAICRHDG